MTRVLIVDDQDLMRAGLRMILEAEPDIETGPQVACHSAAVLRVGLACRVGSLVNASFVEHSLSGRDRSSRAQSKIEGITGSAVEYFECAI
jgi:hypothetical protein